LDAGAPKNLPNNLGWTALHEACFYNRIEIVKTLLLAGADSSLRTKLGALPYHLAGLNEIRNMLKDMGGSDAVPTSAADVIDMVDVLTELTMPETMYKDQAPGTNMLCSVYVIIATINIAALIKQIFQLIFIRWRGEDRRTLGG
jgi:hypothetical protein